MSDALTRIVKTYALDVRQFVVYFGVSGCALAVDFSIYCVLLKVLSFAFAAAIGGYIGGVITHYLVSSRVAFREFFDRGDLAVEAVTLAKYFAAGSTGLFVTAVVTGVLADMLGFNPIVAKVAAAGCSFFVVFLNLRLFVFKSPQQLSPPLA